ncbi:helix-turn-helix domain-containing protein [Bacteriovorax sp. PP10]|uniref:Helix-turn-helix domain-containing protein n=1 Tax=Bacteriovorax antarcticus TaxID=3088717 RepID=A0ABU5VZC9_9BACT|nr:helix-turn-helix domain-containing protein [Bacteriovorax sp. PP10]MEA9358435.1 helix-turn-helix domain-containing protein [Bacteriovorax sp. PP10]
MELRIINLKSITKLTQVALYSAMIIPKGKGVCKVDSGTYPFEGPSILFLTPFQKLNFTEVDVEDVKLLQFHGDFYCIELHQPEVACNGLLFNNVYLSPFIKLSTSELLKSRELFSSIENELKNPDKSILTSYLQLFLAIASRIKRAEVGDKLVSPGKDVKMEEFKELIDRHFLSKRRPSDYAKLLNLQMDSLTKRSKKYFTKSPSQLIHERIIIEARRELHLTRKSVKAIAFTLEFKDEHYFSRFFKKEVGLSPQMFRQKAGISIIADLSI